ncbi:MAG: 1,4-alpha-glucan branching protein GlgB [Anaerolineales bacterium]|nr:1,4-alpha-glucan branching protein GlgB [Anaerolineales bacterium]
MPNDTLTAAIDALMHAMHGAPFEILGIHDAGDGQSIIRTVQPHLQGVTVVVGKARHPMTKRHEYGLWEVTIPTPGEGYHMMGTTTDGQPITFDDPYSFPPTLTDYDIYLLGEGTHLNAYDKLGAHLIEIDGVAGVRFTVWAPNAKRISIVGNFNGWDDRMHPMRHLSNGFWELFIPGMKDGEVYKYDILSHNAGYKGQKCDPYGFRTEVRPNNASIVCDLSGYTWGDAEWMGSREARNGLKAPVAIYEVHLGSWRRKEDGTWLSYRELAHELVDYVKSMNFTHIELMPVAEHPLDASWGYQVTGYFAPTSRFGSPADFMYFVDRCHQNGIGVLLDWVPAHFPKDGHALSYFDGTHLYEHADSRQGEHPDWGTLIFNYGRNEVRNFLISNALFWLDKYHIDGLRVDAVSSMLYLDFSRKAGEWIPNRYGSNENLEAISFLKQFNEIVHDKFPGAVTVAEESTAWAMVSRPVYIGGLGFTYKWNMGWMHDTLKYISKDPVYRRWEHNSLTFSMLYAFNENFVLSLSHDEVVHMKGSLIHKIAGDWWQKFATLRLLLGYQYTHPGKKLNFMGAEFGQWNEWSETRSLDWYLLELPTHTSMQAWTRDLNRFYCENPALYEVDFDWTGFKWINANDSDNSIFSYARFAADASNFLVVVLNLTPVVRERYTIGVPEAGAYREVLNSDSAFYGGSNVGNGGGVQASDSPWGEFPASLSLTIPPLGMLILKRDK